jgi:peroxidase
MKTFAEWVRDLRPRLARPGRIPRLYLEVLEERCVPSDFRTITGFGNNVNHPTWGQSGTDLLRVSAVAYADGKSAPSTPNALSPREISNDLNNQSDPIFSFADNLGSANNRNLTDFSYVWGQFIDHDMDLTLDNSGQSFDIPADPTRTDDQMGIEGFTRSNFDPNTGTSTGNPRQQINSVTSYLDLSQVYGSTQVVADALRTFSGGKLKTSPGNLLPLNNTTYFTTTQLAALNMANDAHQVPDSQLFAAGDRRANENIELTALQTLFMRNHNRIATFLATQNPANYGFTSWNDERLYQEARKINIAEEEIITYTEYLPSVLGNNALPAFTAYNANVNAGIATEFSTVGFRFGHSQLDGEVERQKNDGTDITDVSPDGADVSLVEDFFRPDLVNPNGATVNLIDLDGNPDPHTSSDIGNILKANADGNAQEVDLFLVDEVRNVLFGIPNVPGTDLAARDIQRARDHGIGTYNQVRAAYGLSAVTSFSQITSNVAIQNELQATYGTVDKIDPFEGMLAEDHVAGDVGPTIKAILAKQFAALRDGDRFFYLNQSFTTAEQNLIAQGNTLAEVIENNTPITNLQSNVFIFTASISGSVFLDADGGGVRASSDPPLTGFTVNLNDDDGNVVASTTTDINGNYSFTNQTGIPGTGNFTVTVSLPPGWAQSAAQIAHNPGTIAVSRGGLTFTNENFAVLRASEDFSGGFASTAGLQLNGSAKVNGSVLQLTDGGNNEAGSAFTTGVVSVAKFSTDFSFQLVNPNADGITFTLQGQGATALGSSGGGLGYGTDGVNPGPVITPSVAVKFDLFNNNGEGNNSTGLYIDGASPTNVGSVNLNGTGIDLHSGHVFDVGLNYNGKFLTETITDTVTGASFSHIYAVNIAGILGGGNGFVGFTGGTGGLTATQDILSWTYGPITISPNFAGGFASTAGLQLNGSAAVSGTRLRLTDGGNNEAASVFTTSSVDVSQFATSFNFQLTNPNADGFTFTLQAHDPSQLGAGGGGLGYQGITNSVAIKFDLFNNSGEGINSTGLYLNGAAPTNVGSVDLTGSGIDLHSGHVFNVTLSYDGTTLTETITDTQTGASFTVAYKVNVVAVLGRSTAFVGFTGGTGGLTATEDILAWNFTGLA